MTTTPSSADQTAATTSSTQVAPTEQPSLTAPIAFTDLIADQDLLAALERVNIKSPTKVQAATVPPACSGKDLIVQAQTGSGKTLAFVIPLILKIRSQPKVRDTLGLVVSPTRELATQINEVISSIAPDIKPVCVIGGASAKEQIEDLGEDRRIVVGTPGRLMDMLRRRILNLRRCQYFVLDEADEMLSMGFLEDVRSILSRLPDQRQGLFISATVTPRVRMLAESFLTKPDTIVIDRDNSSAVSIEHLFCDVGSELAAKALAICDLIETERPRSAIIFCNTKSDTELVEKFLRRRGFDASRINSDLSQKQREKIMQRARNGDLQILVATDVAARGIDIDHLDIVFSYSIHEQHEVYIHRTGRTGRAGRSGKAICLVSPYDFAAFHNLKKRLTFEIKKMNLPSQEDVIDARLAHFYELLRSAKAEITDKEKTIAKKMLADLADIADPGEEIVEIIGKLYSIALQRVTPSPEQDTAKGDNEGEDQVDQGRHSSPDEEYSGGHRRHSGGREGGNNRRGGDRYNRGSGRRR